jgi:hypothetical protein
VRKKFDFLGSTSFFACIGFGRLTECQRRFHEMMSVEAGMMGKKMETAQ